MWWRNIKFCVYIVLLLMLLVYIGLVMMCGGFALSGCIGSNNNNNN